MTKNTYRIGNIRWVTVNTGNRGWETIQTIKNIKSEIYKKNIIFLRYARNIQILIIWKKITYLYAMHEIG